MNPTEIFSHHIVITNEVLFSTLNFYTVIFMLQFERKIEKYTIQKFHVFLYSFNYICRGMHNKIGTTAQFYYSHSVL